MDIYSDTTTVNKCRTTMMIYPVLTHILCGVNKGGDDQYYRRGTRVVTDNSLSYIRSPQSDRWTILESLDDFGLAKIRLPWLLFNEDVYCLEYQSNQSTVGQ